MNIKGFYKSTMIDFPNKLAAEIFTGGCNFRCPFCHNGDLVENYEESETIDTQTVIDHLKKRKGIIEGLVITGGEPTLCEGLSSFIGRVKDLEIKVKLDTNGYNPEILEKLIKDKKIDYVAMDIKNSFDKYGLTAGLKNLKTSQIKKSIDIIMNSGIDYEFRTTLIKQFHGKNDIIKMAEQIQGCEKYYLQQYESSEKELGNKVFDFYTVKEMQDMKLEILNNYKIKEIGIRGRF